MNVREQKGFQLAAVAKIRCTKGIWHVPSQSKPAVGYSVNLDKKTCTCKDHVDRNLKCKHIYAVEIVKRREAGEIIEIPSIDPASKAPKVTYKQNWPAYNKAQTTEKLRFATLLYHLCNLVYRGSDGTTRRMALTFT